MSVGQYMRRLGAPLGVMAGVAASALLGLTRSDADDRRAAPVIAGAMHVNEPDHAAYAEAMKRAGLDSVQVTVYARQGAWDSADLTFDRDTTDLRREIAAARRAGLKVVLVLRMYLDHGIAENRHLWHGLTWPRDDQLDAWFARYGEYALWGAELAATSGVDVLAIGNELDALTSTLHTPSLPDRYAFLLSADRMARVHRLRTRCDQPVPGTVLAPDLAWADGKRFTSLTAAFESEDAANRRWAERVLRGGADETPHDVLRRRSSRHEAAFRGLIAEIRARYRGTLTYSANFHVVGEVGFWDALDAVGVTAYFPQGMLGLEVDARRALLLSRWREIAHLLERVAESGGGAAPMPVYLLELGWTKRLGSTVRPWSYDRLEVLETAHARGGDGDGDPSFTCVLWANQPNALAERREAMQALTQVVREGEFPSLRGFSLWKVTTRDYHWNGEPYAVLLPTSDTTPIPEDLALLGSAEELARLLATRK